MVQQSWVLLTKLGVLGKGLRTTRDASNPHASQNFYMRTSQVSKGKRKVKNYHSRKHNNLRGLDIVLKRQT